MRMSGFLKNEEYSKSLAFAAHCMHVKICGHMRAASKSYSYTSL